MSTMFKHLNPRKAPTMKMMLGRLTVTPAMQAIVVDGEPIVNPQFASVVGNDAESDMASPEKSHTCCPTHSKMITSGETWPPSTCITIVHGVPPASHIWPTVTHAWARAAHTEVEDVLPKETMSIHSSGS
jgi:hypothetical protein